MNTPLPDAPSRRNVLKGAAWATPAVVVASAAPAFAASPGTGGGSLAAPILRADDFGGLRVLLTGERPFVVNDLRIHNDGLVPLEAGQLVVTIETPTEWGNGLTWDATRAGQVLPNAEWDFSVQGRVATFTSRPGANAIAPGAYIDPLPAGLDWAWWLDSDAVATGTKQITVTLGVVDQANVRAVKYVRSFTGNSWLSTIDMVEVTA